MQHSKWLAKLGAVGYDALIHINRIANFISEHIFKTGKLSLEYNDGEWKIYRYDEAEMEDEIEDEPGENILSNDELFENMVADFNLMK